MINLVGKSKLEEWWGSASNMELLGGAARSCCIVQARWEGPVEAQPLPLEAMRGVVNLFMVFLARMEILW